MKIGDIISVLLIPLIFSCAKRTQQDYPIQPVRFHQIKITDHFWSKRLETNHKITIPYVFSKCEETGRLNNFAIAAGLKEGEQSGVYPFDDTDVYKTIEGASFSLMLFPDPELEAYLDSIITLIAAAQEPDGYLYTARTNQANNLRLAIGEQRWSNLSRSHELYNSGHLYEAAAAHFTATRKKSLLNVAVKNAELILKTFGPGKLEIPPGHQVIEMGLARLYRVTGDKRYLDLAKYFLDLRGKSVNNRKLGGPYNQDHKPVLEQDEAVGHAVRAAYQYAGMADVAALLNVPEYGMASAKLWENVVSRKLYLTGGIGATGSGEAFGENYELPNMSAYNETCSSLANVFWNHRMFLLFGEGKYIDILERALYNAALAGISMDGSHFFYPNPLESVGQHERSPWFTCACCPGNVTRFIASLADYVYAVRENELFVNLFVRNEANLTVNNKPLQIRQKTGYPWQGEVEIQLNPESDLQRFTLKIRIPGWAGNEVVPGDLYHFFENYPAAPEIQINSEKIEFEVKNGYAGISRDWKRGDRIKLHLPMPVRRVVASEKVEADLGKVALQRGPIVYCLEGADHQDGHVRNLLLPDDVVFTTEFKDGLLNWVQVVRGKALAYKSKKNSSEIISEEMEFTAIPYYAWAHRGKNEMTVWLAREKSAVSPLHGPTIASTAKISVSSGKNPQAVNDQLEPGNSIDHDVPFFHWWPNKGTKEWVQFDFEKIEEVSLVEVYWFDDTGRGECRLPQSWKVYFRDFKNNSKWRPVYSYQEYPILKDRFNRVAFETVRTNALKIEIQSQPEWAGGIHEIKIK